MFPSRPVNEAELVSALSEPAPGLGEVLDHLGGDIVLLGAGGKVGPTMALMAQRALNAVNSSAKVIAVSRWSDPSAAKLLRDAGVEVRVADLSLPESYASLPDAAAVYYLAAMKFGTTGNEPVTWWSNASVPTLVSARYRGVPTVVYSTGNVYDFTPVHWGGSLENQPLGPLGEYAQSCLARERVFTAAAERWETPTTIFRLNYACEFRYGVIADLAQKVIAREPIDVTMPAVNVVWQADSSDWSLRCIELAGVPPRILNGTGPETVSVRKMAQFIAERVGVEVEFVGEESPSALLSDAGECFSLYGYPRLPARTLIEWVTDWVAGGGELHHKATKFQTTDGRY